MKSAYKINGNWIETKAKLKQKFALLTENDLLFVKGKQQETISKIQVRLNKTKEEVEKILSEL